MDPRESILARLEAILTEMGVFTTVLRNDIQVPESKLPGAVLLDGDELPDEDSGKVRPGRGPVIMRMAPEIYVLVQEEPANVGPNLNLTRAQMVDRICTDTQLLALAKDGDVRYIGMQTGLAIGRSMKGEAGLMFSIAYVAYPGRLAPPITETST
jgi:hypothetical protein